MPYYMGDYYRGDFYTKRLGDPGFWSVLGNIGKSALGAITGIQLPSKAAPAITAAAAGASAPLAQRIGKGIATTVLKHPVLTAAGAAGILGATAGGTAGVIAGKRRAAAAAAANGGRRRRRMRPTNTKALRRALRRAYAFERIAMRTIKLVHPRKHGRFGGFKRAKKRVC